MTGEKDVRGEERVIVPLGQPEIAEDLRSYPGFRGERPETIRQNHDSN